MKRGQVFVRAKSPSGKWGTHDALDLEQESFNAFILEMLVRNELVCSIKEDAVEGKKWEYQSTVEEKE